MQSCSWSLAAGSDQVGGSTGAQSGSASEAGAEGHPCAGTPPRPVLFAELASRPAKGPAGDEFLLSREGVGLDVRMVLSSPMQVTDF